MIGRFLVPTVADLIFLVLLVAWATGSLAPRLLDDAGIGWHIRDGQQILQTHAVPHSDPFSVSTSGKAWYAWEWLYDILAASLHAYFGLNGLVFLTAAIIAATFALTLSGTLADGAKLPVSVVLVVLAIAASSIHFFARPHVLSWLFSLIWFRVLDSYESGTRGKAWIWWLPLLTLIWVNVHGGFLAGFVLLALYLAAGTIGYLVSRSQQQKRAISARLKRLGLVTALSIAATLANPYGYRLHVHIYRYLSDRFLMNHIEEFQSPNFHGMPQKCFAVLLLFTIAAMASARGKPRASHLLVVIFAVCSALYASRNLPVSSILLTLVIAPLLSQEISEVSTSARVSPWLHRALGRYESFASRMTRVEMQSCRHLWPIVGLLLGLWVAAQGGYLGSRQIMNAHFRESRFPVHAVNAVAASEVAEPIFAPDYWGGYLIYRLYPRVRVLVDDRHDLYGDEFFKNYLMIILVQPEWKRELDDTHVNRVLVPSESSLANIMKLSPQWKIVYADDTAVLFTKQN